MELEDINLPVKAAELLAKALNGIGLDLPLAFAQIFAFVLYAAAFVWGIKRIREEGFGKLAGWLVSVAFGLGMVGIVSGWTLNLMSPLPTRVTGQVRLDRDGSGMRLSNVRVALLDFRGNTISKEPGIVDSESGFFALSYEQSFGDRPRSIRTVAPGCADQVTAIGRSRLKSGASFLVIYACEQK